MGVKQNKVSEGLGAPAWFEIMLAERWGPKLQALTFT